METILLLHCSGSSGAQWRSLAEKLGTRYRVIAPDLIGYGKAAAGPARRVLAGAGSCGVEPAWPGASGRAFVRRRGRAAHRAHAARPSQKPDADRALRLPPAARRRRGSIPMRCSRSPASPRRRGRRSRAATTSAASAASSTTGSPAAGPQCRRRSAPRSRRRSPRWRSSSTRCSTSRPGSRTCAASSRRRCCVQGAETRLPVALRMQAAARCAAGGGVPAGARRRAHAAGDASRRGEPAHRRASRARPIRNGRRPPEHVARLGHGRRVHGDGGDGVRRRRHGRRVPPADRRRVRVAARRRRGGILGRHRGDRPGRDRDGTFRRPAAGAPRGAIRARWSRASPSCCCPDWRARPRSTCCTR